MPPDAEKPYIVEIQINKNKFNGQEVKLILVRSIDFLVDHQAESVKMKRDRMLQSLFQHELIDPLNCIVTQSRQLLDNRKLLYHELKKATDKNLESSAILSQIWGSSKILEYLVQSVRGRKRF